MLPDSVVYVKLGVFVLLLKINVTSLHCFYDFNSVYLSGLSGEEQCIQQNKVEPPHDKTNKMICGPGEDSGQPGHPPSLIRVFALRMKKYSVLTYPCSALEDSDKTGRMTRLI